MQTGPEVGVNNRDLGVSVGLSHRLKEKSTVRVTGSSSGGEDARWRGEHLSNPTRKSVPASSAQKLN